MGNFVITFVGNFITLVGIITVVGNFITLVGAITSRKFYYTCGYNKVSITIFEYTHRINQPCGRCDIISLYDSLQPSVFKICLVYIESVKNCSPSMQALEITL